MVGVVGCCDFLCFPTAQKQSRYRGIIEKFSFYLGMLEIANFITIWGERLKGNEYYGGISGAETLINFCFPHSSLPVPFLPRFIDVGFFFVS